MTLAFIYCLQEVVNIHALVDVKEESDPFFDCEVMKAYSFKLTGCV